MYSLETERLLLRPFKADDVAFLDYLHSDFDVVRYTSGHTRSHNQNIAYIKTMQDLHDLGLGHLVVVRKADNVAMGRCGFSYFSAVNDGEMDWFYWGGPENVNQEIASKGGIFKFLELGYSFAKKYWGKGYATEAAYALTQFGFETLSFDEISSLVVKENIGSIGVAHKLGRMEVSDCMVHDAPSYHLRNRNNG